MEPRETKANAAASLSSRQSMKPSARRAIDFFIAESRHGYTATMYPTVYQWLAKWFGLPEPAPESLVERPIALESETTLNCTLSGR